MADLTSGLKAWYIKAMAGMNNKVEDLEKKTKWVGLAQNCRFESEPGSVDKRSALSFYNTATTGVDTPIESLYRYYTKGASSGTSVKICGTEALVGDDSAGTWTAIRTGLTDGKRCTFVVYKDILISGNGYDNIWCYDGSDDVTWELGSCKAVLNVAAGNLDSASTYYYAVTFNTQDDGAGTRYGINGAVSNTVTTGTGSYEQVDLSNIPIGPSVAPYREIWRTEGDGSSLYRIATKLADTGATTYTDNVADTTATAYPAVADDMPLGSILKIHREKLFITGDPSNPNKIYYSAPYLPWYIRQTTNTDYMEIDADDGDQIMGVPIQLGTMVCIKKNNIRKLHITSATSGADPATWYAEDPVAFVGTPAQWSVQQTPYGVIFLGWDHWYKFDGVNAIPVIDEFDSEAILSSSYSDVVAHWSQLGTLLWAYADAVNAPSYHDTVGRYNFKRQALSIDVVSDDSNGLKHGINCFSSNVGDDENGELYYGSSTHGFVYKAEQNELQYALTTKSQATAGTSNNTFEGGTDASPYIEIGSTSSADTIPDDVCIFWDDADSTPGSGWTEITDDDAKFIKIDDDSAAGTNGTVGTSAGSQTSANYVDYRVFKADTCTTTEFPSGAIVMYNQASNPSGWSAEGSDYYVRINSDISTPTGIITVYPEEDTGAGDTLDNEATFRFIKKIGDADTWDGDETKRVYCLYYGATFTFNACTGADESNALEFTDAGHGMSDGAEVTFKAATLPTGITLGQSYYVVNKDTNTFQVSTAIGGSAVAYTDAGTTVTYAEDISGFIEVTKAYDEKHIRTASDDGTKLGGATAVPFDWLNQPGVTHTYTALNYGQVYADANGYKSIDGDTDTAFEDNDGNASSATATCNSISAHAFDVAKTLTKCVYKLTAGADTGVAGETSKCWVQYSTDAVGTAIGDVSWTDLVTASNGTSSASLDATWTGSQAGVTFIRAYAYAKAEGGPDNNNANSGVYEITAEAEADSVAFKLTSAILGRMIDFNSALITANTEGVWESPQSQIDANSLKQLFWNESKGASDDVQFFIRTAATAAALAGTATTTGAVTDNAPGMNFAKATHGLEDDDRVTINAGTMPDDENGDLLTKNFVYYVKKIDAGNFEISTTSSAGANVSIDSNGADYGATVTYKTWDDDAGGNTYTDPNGGTINNTANVWFEYAVAFTAADTTVSNPKIYFTNGYVVKMTYDKQLTAVETAVSFKYEIGFRNFDQPFVDKIFKKVATWHETQDTSTGSFTVFWKVDIDGIDGTGNRYDEYDPDTTGEKSFTISMASFPRRWETFFPSMATGRSLSLMIYKNDLEEFKLREIKGLYTAEPVII